VSYCETTKGKRCFVQETENTRKLLSNQAEEIRSAIKDARVGHEEPDVTNYTSLEKMADNQEEIARRNQLRINNTACPNCPYIR
jgi:hypothetical protein